MSDVEGMAAILGEHQLLNNVPICSCRNWQRVTSPMPPTTFAEHQAEVLADAGYGKLTTLRKAAEEAERRSMEGAYFPEWGTTARLINAIADDWSDNGK